MLVQVEQRTTGQTISNNTLTTASFNTVVENDMNFTLTTPVTIVTVNIEGTYVVTASVGFDSGTTGYRSMFLEFLNPQLLSPTWVPITSAYVGASIAGIKQLNCSAIVRLSVGFQIRLRYLHTQGANITTAVANTTNGTPNATLAIALVVP